MKEIRIYEVACCDMCPNCKVGSPGFDLDKWSKGEQITEDYLTCDLVEGSHILDNNIIAKFCPLKVLQ